MIREIWEDWVRPKSTNAEAGKQQPARYPTDSVAPASTPPANGKAADAVENPTGAATSSGARERGAPWESWPADEPQVAINAADPQLLERILEVLHSCYDPEIPVDIYELGLIYAIDVSPIGEVAVKMTLTSPGCPVAGSLPGEVEVKLRGIPGVQEVQVELVWDPPWSQSRMSEAARLTLGFF